jgi:hypothetical protein
MTSSRPRETSALSRRCRPPCGCSSTSRMRARCRQLSRPPDRSTSSSATQVRHFGISVSVLQPGAVSSGGAERAKSFLDDSSPYRPLLDQLGGFRSDPVSVEEVAKAVADAIDEAGSPFRIPHSGRRSRDQHPCGQEGRPGGQAVHRRATGVVVTRSPTRRLRPNHAQRSKIVVPTLGVNVGGIPGLPALGPLAM